MVVEMNRRRKVLFQTSKYATEVGHQHTFIHNVTALKVIKNPHGAFKTEFPMQSVRILIETEDGFSQQFDLFLDSEKSPEI
tara:strand:+ start:525 stop:767 length:243 start_codon:yes stop_codon:yes gene_type:complete